MISKFGIWIGLAADLALGVMMVAVGLTLIIAAQAGWLYVI